MEHVQRRLCVLAKAVREDDWRPEIGGSDSELLRSFSEMGWVELADDGERYRVAVTSRGLDRFVAWGGDSVQC